MVGTKPYAATGKYTQRMSDYCTNCRFDPGERTGAKACPVTVSYWDFLIRTRVTLSANHRMAMILKNVDRLEPEDRARITTVADRLRREFGISSAPRPRR